VRTHVAALNSCIEALNHSHEVSGSMRSRKGVEGHMLLARGFYKAGSKMTQCTLDRGDVPGSNKQARAASCSLQGSNLI
jgi:hypothetical protein